MTTELPDLTTSEQVVTCSDPATGLRAVIAIDDTTLGPGLGGVRFRRYASFADAVTESQRLARAMTLKNAAAGLPYGGAKSVILDSGDAAARPAQIRRFGEFVAHLGGAYLPGVDMGTTVADLRAMGDAGASTTCSDEDPSPWTALGVFHALRSATAVELSTANLRNLRVLVQGAGNVGARLASMLADAGAAVAVSDIDSDRAADVAASVGGIVVAPDQVIGHECEVFAPCATAKVVSHENISQLRCRIIAGAANDTLEDRECASALDAAGVLYVPDFMANAGGVLHVHGLLSGWDTHRLESEIGAIGRRVSDVLWESRRVGALPLETAETVAFERIRAQRSASEPVGAAS